MKFYDIQKRWHTVNAWPTVLFTIYVLTFSSLAYYIPVIPPQAPLHQPNTVFRQQQSNNFDDGNSNNDNIFFCCDDPQQQQQNCCHREDDGVTIMENGGKDLVYPLDNPTLQYQLEEEIKNYPFRSDTNGYGTRVEKDSYVPTIADAKVAEMPDQALIIPLPAITAFLMRKKDGSTGTTVDGDAVANKINTANNCGNYIANNTKTIDEESNKNNGQVYGKFIPQSRNSINCKNDNENANYGNCCSSVDDNCCNCKSYSEEKLESSSSSPYNSTTSQCSTVCNSTVFGRCYNNDTVCGCGSRNSNKTTMNYNSDQEQKTSNNNKCFNSPATVVANSNSVVQPCCCCMDCCPNELEQQNDDSDGNSNSNFYNNSNKNCCCQRYGSCCQRCDRSAFLVCDDPCCPPNTVCDDNCNDCCCNNCCCCGYCRNANDYNENNRKPSNIVPNFKKVDVKNSGYGSNCRTTQNYNSNSIKNEKCLTKGCSDCSKNIIQFNPPVVNNTVMNDANRNDSNPATGAENVTNTVDYGNNEVTVVQNPFTANSGGFGRLGSKTRGELRPEEDSFLKETTVILPNLTKDDNNHRMASLTSLTDTSTSAISSLNLTIPTVEGFKSITTTSLPYPIIFVQEITTKPSSILSTLSGTVTTMSLSTTTPNTLYSTLIEESTTQPETTKTTTNIQELLNVTIPIFKFTPTIVESANKTTVEFLQKIDPITTNSPETTTTAATAPTTAEATTPTTRTVEHGIKSTTTVSAMTINSTESTAIIDKLTTVNAKGIPKSTTDANQLPLLLPENTVEKNANNTTVFNTVLLNSTFNDDVISENEAKLIGLNQQQFVSDKLISNNPNDINKPISVNLISDIQNDINKEVVLPWNENHYNEPEILIKTEKRQLKNTEFNEENYLPQTAVTAVTDDSSSKPNDDKEKNNNAKKVNDIGKNFDQPSMINQEPSHSHTHLKSHSLRHDRHSQQKMLEETTPTTVISKQTTKISSKIFSQTQFYTNIIDKTSDTVEGQQGDIITDTTAATVLTSDATTAKLPVAVEVQKSLLSVEQQLKSADADEKQRNNNEGNYFGFATVWLNHDPPTTVLIATTASTVSTTIKKRTIAPNITTVISNKDTITVNSSAINDTVNRQLNTTYTVESTANNVIVQPIAKNITAKLLEHRNSISDSDAFATTRRVRQPTDWATIHDAKAKRLKATNDAAESYFNADASANSGAAKNGKKWLFVSVIILFSLINVLRIV